VVDIYSIGGIFLGASFIWWGLFRTAPSVWVLILPWFFFTLSFFLAGVTALVPSLSVAHRLMRAAMLLYAFASAAGVFFFSLNFGEEAVSCYPWILNSRLQGSATATWVIRSLIIQSVQQVWVALLWFWGHTYDGTDPQNYQAPKWLLGITWPLTILCGFSGCMLYAGLPTYCKSDSIVSTNPDPRLAVSRTHAQSMEYPSQTSPRPLVPHSRDSERLLALHSIRQVLGLHLGSLCPSRVHLNGHDCSVSGHPTGATHFALDDQPDPYLGPTHVQRRARCSAVVSDLLGHVRNRIVPALGRRFWAVFIHSSLAVAWGTRWSAGCRNWDNVVANSLPSTCRSSIVCAPDHRCNNGVGCPCICASQ
jgi:hypothetical protein